MLPLLPAEPRSTFGETRAAHHAGLSLRTNEPAVGTGCGTDCQVGSAVLEEELGDELASAAHAAFSKIDFRWPWTVYRVTSIRLGDLVR